MADAGRARCGLSAGAKGAGQRLPGKRTPRSRLRCGLACAAALEWVAILSRVGDVHETGRGLPGDPTDDQSRYIEAAVNGVLIAGLVPA